jgi:CRP/FNR family cyclic AMP-dependent transcriptional regulator
MKTELSRSENQGSPLSPVLNEIAEHPFLRGLRQEDLSILADCAMRSHFEPGEQIFREGDPANRLYLIKSGKIALETTTEHGRRVLQFIGANDVLGWSWLFPPYYWHFDARAIERTEAVFLYGTRLRELCEEKHDLGYEIMKRTANVLISRLTATRRDLAAKQ